MLEALKLTWLAIAKTKHHCEMCREYRLKRQFEPDLIHSTMLEF